MQPPAKPLRDPEGGPHRQYGQQESVLGLSSAKAGMLQSGKKTLVYTRAAAAAAERATVVATIARLAYVLLKPSSTARRYIDLSRT